MDRLHTHYDTLKVSRDAPSEVIRSAYRALARKYHPDSNPDLEESVKAMQAINQAFEVLIDPVQRKAHDEWIDQQSAENSSATNDEAKKTGKFTHAGQSRANIPRTDKLTPGVVVGIIAAAAALIALVIIALEAQGRYSSKHSPSSESTPGPAASPTPAATPLPVATPTPTPTPDLTPDPVNNPSSEVELIPGIPNAWITKHGLSALDSNLPTNDPDNDGFTNIEEFRAGSNPVDGNSRPPAWTKLRLVSAKTDKLRIKFVSPATRDLEIVAITTLSEHERSGVPRFYKKGDVIVFSEAQPDGREAQTPTPLTLTDVRRVKRSNPQLNAEELVPVITLKNNADGLELQLAPDEVKDLPYTLTILRDTRSGEEFTLRTGETLDLDDGQTYKLIEASEKYADLQSLTTRERLRIPRLEPDAVVRLTPATTRMPAQTPEPTDPLVKLLYQMREDIERRDRTDSAEANKLQGIWIRDSDFTIFQFRDENRGVYGRDAKFKVTYLPDQQAFHLDWGPSRGWTNTLRYGADRDTLEGQTESGASFILRRVR